MLPLRGVGVFSCEKGGRETVFFVNYLELAEGSHKGEGKEGELERLAGSSCKRRREGVFVLIERRASCLLKKNKSERESLFGSREFGIKEREERASILAPPWDSPGSYGVLSFVTSLYHSSKVGGGWLRFPFRHNSCL